MPDYYLMMLPTIKLKLLSHLTQKAEGKLSFMKNANFAQRPTRSRQGVWRGLTVLAATLVIFIAIGSILMFANVTQPEPIPSQGSTRLPQATSTTPPKLKPGEVVYQSKNTYSRIPHLKWSPDGKRIAALLFPDGNDRANILLQSWDALTHQSVLTYSVPGISFYGAGDIAWSTDGKRLAIATQKVTVIKDGKEQPLPTDSKVYIFDAQTTRLLIIGLV